MADDYAQIPAHTGFFFTPTLHQDAPSELDPAKVQLPEPCVVCITGGGRGLGEAYALAFAKAGASDIILTARSSKGLEAVAVKVRDISKSIRVSTVVCDVSSETDVTNLANVVRKDHGGSVHVLINSAGYLDAGWKPLNSFSAQDFLRVFEVNVCGVFLVTRTLLPLMLEARNKTKTIISISSLTSHIAGPSIAMGMSKLAVNRFMEYLAVAHGAEGLMCYSLHPGGVKTAMSQDTSKVPSELAASKCCPPLPFPKEVFIPNTSVYGYAGTLSGDGSLAGQRGKAMVEWSIFECYMGYEGAREDEGRDRARRQAEIPHGCLTCQSRGTVELPRIGAALETIRT